MRSLRADAADVPFRKYASAFLNLLFLLPHPMPFTTECFYFVQKIPQHYKNAAANFSSI
jgi:hypothetical protein